MGNKTHHGVLLGELHELCEGHLARKWPKSSLRIDPLAPQLLRTFSDFWCYNEAQLHNSLIYDIMHYNSIAWYWFSKSLVQTASKSRATATVWNRAIFNEVASEKE